MEFKAGMTYDEYYENLLNTYKDKDIDYFTEEFKKLTMNYQHSLLSLYNCICISSKIPFNDEKTIMFRQNIQQQIKMLIRNPIFSENLEAFCSMLNLTEKEQEIISAIYFGIGYKQLYKDILIISKRTFDDHLKRIAQKIYNHIEEEKKNFPNYVKIYPNYAVKQNMDGSFTFAKPYQIISQYLKYSL